jgi:nitronate monooxygenase
MGAGGTHMRYGWPPGDALRAGLRLPVIASPMFLVSGPDLVIAACRAGIVGAFPALNVRTPDQLNAWIDQIETALQSHELAAPYAVNLVLARGADDPMMGACMVRKPPIVITSIGNPAPVVKRVHDWGGIVLHDVTTLRHAEKAAEAGVDGIILVRAGAGGHSGPASPFALGPQVRRMFDGLLVVGGGIGHGSAILAAEALGADLVYMGTRFLATQESGASDDYKQAVLSTRTQDVQYTPAISGLAANFLRPSIIAAGLDPDNLPPPPGQHWPDLPQHVKPWRDIWSAGHAVGLIDDLPTVADLIGRLEDEYREAARRLGDRERRNGQDNKMRSLAWEC